MTRVGWIIFEGGETGDWLGQAMYSVRREAVVSNLEEIAASGACDEICLVTDKSELAQEARSLGVRVVWTGSVAFSFGSTLAQVIEHLRLEAVVCSGGGAVPLLAAADVTDIAGRLKECSNVVLVNNVQSPDLVGFCPASALYRGRLPDTDNELGEALRELGLRRKVLPPSFRLSLDLDTPTDVVIVGTLPWTKPRIKAAAERLGWPTQRLRAAVSFLERPMSEIALVGRVSTQLITFLNLNFQVRLRIFCEERGMKALGRQARGEVVSVLGTLFQLAGMEKAFEAFESVCHAAFFDSRVLFAHWRRAVSQWDRFHSDLGLWKEIRDPVVRGFTKAAIERAVPVVLGGHSLVSGGLWALGEALLYERGIPPIRPVAQDKNGWFRQELS